MGRAGLLPSISWIAYIGGAQAAFTGLLLRHCARYHWLHVFPAFGALTPPDDDISSFSGSSFLRIPETKTPDARQ